jgi:hypothetical protein
MSYNGKYARFSHERSGFDSLHRRHARPLVEALHARHWFNSRRIHSAARAALRVRRRGSGNFPVRNNPIAASTLGRAAVFRSRCWRTVAAHIRGSDGSIPSTATTTSAHSSKPYTQGRRSRCGCPEKHRGFDTRARSSPLVGVVQRSVPPSLERMTRVRFPSPIPSPSSTRCLR